MPKQRAVVIGGGLAGMTVAKELLKRNLDVLILEAGDRMGGKAGADYRAADQLYVEHGYHVFPAWYHNTLNVLRELEIDGHLIPLYQKHNLIKGEYPKFSTTHEATLRNTLRNVFQGVLPWPEMLLGAYFVLDLCRQPFRYRGFLDRISVNGFLRSRFYATEGTASLQQQEVLQAQSVPFYEISAMSLQKVLQSWLSYPSPRLSMLNGNLQTQFIQPFEQRLRDLGAEVRFHQRVQKLVIDGQRVVDVCFADQSRLGPAHANDLFVLATPPEVTRRFVDDDVYAAEHAMPETDDRPHSLAGLEHLVTAPMASLTVYLNRRIDLPKEHISLIGSRHSISFVDVAQHWPEIDRQQFPTVLNAIAGNFEALHGLSLEGMTKALIAELTSYVTAIEPQDIARCHLQPNLEFPLFLNTVGSWRYRPETRTRLANLYIAGDYCRSEADLTTMESAIGSALATARELLQDQGLPSNVGLQPLKPRGAWYFTLLTYLLLPFIVGVVAGQAIGLLPKQHLKANQI